MAQLTLLLRRLLLEIGGITVVFATTWKRVAKRRWDSAELWRAVWSYAYSSFALAALLGVFIGFIMVLLSEPYMRNYGVYDRAGWFVAFAAFREIAPLLVGLLLSGRVGAAHASELAAMRDSEQLDALRVLALDVYEVLVVPRTLAMIIAVVFLLNVADLFAILAGALSAQSILRVGMAQFIASVSEFLDARDFLVGLLKAFLFAAAIASVSTYYGISARRGARGIGHAVHGQVVSSALCLFVLDYVVSAALR